jgi:SAM-dependent methyltransferase
LLAQCRWRLAPRTGAGFGLDRHGKLNAELNALKASLSHVFPYAAYREKRPDLSTFNDQQLVEHFTTFGIREGVDIQHINLIKPETNKARPTSPIEVRLQKLANQLRLSRELTIAQSIEYYLETTFPDEANSQAPRDPLCETSPKILASGSESTCVINNGVVTKIYTEDYFRYNREHGRTGEGSIIKTLPSSLHLEILQDDECFLCTPYYGMAVGERIGSQHDKKACFLQGEDIASLIRWLSSLHEKLISAKISHHDINLCNILFDSVTGKFTLIDYAWATQDNAPPAKTFKNHPTYLNNGLAEDSEAIREITCFLIRKLISDIGKNGYKDGSSVSKGFTYCKLPFDEFSDVPFHKDHAKDEFAQIRQHAGDLLSNSSILELGSAVGEFTFRLAENSKHVTAIEANSFAYRVAEALKIYRKFSNIDFYNTDIESYVANSEDTFEICLCMNVHMWVEKQLGRERTIELLRNLSQRVRHFYFQTAHSKSGGMYLVEYLKNSNDIALYLANCGFIRIEEISRTASHGGERILFYCQGAY